jgi:hypothetical protein
VECVHLLPGVGIEADHDAVAGARGAAIERLADPDGLAVTGLILRIADGVAVIGELLPADGAEHGIVEGLGLCDIVSADGDGLIVVASLLPGSYKLLEQNKNAPLITLRQLN